MKGNKSHLPAWLVWLATSHSKEPLILQTEGNHWTTIAPLDSRWVKQN